MKVFLAIAALLLVVGSYLKLGVVVGRSMEPTLRPGQWFVMQRANALSRPLRAGDVVDLNHKGENIVKRVVGLPGETIQVPRPRIELRRFVGRTEDGKKVDMVGPVRVMQMEKVTVPGGQLFVVGDNLPLSQDSRHFGFVPVTSIQGRGLFLRQPPAFLARLFPGVQHAQG